MDYLNMLEKNERIDGRYYLFLIIALFFFILFVSLVFYNFNIMKSMGVDVWEPSFADLRVITSGLDCIRLGNDPLVYNPCDPWKRKMNYPRIWHLLEKLGINESHTFALGVSLAICFYLSLLRFLPKINKYEGVIYSLIILSPAGLLAVERGNSDLLVFIFLSIALVYFIKNKFLFYGTLIFCSTIKYYPFFGLTVAFKESKRTFIKILLFFGSIFTTYLFFSFRDLILIFYATARTTYFSYGSMVIVQRFSLFIDKFSKVHIKYLFIFILFWIITYFFIFVSYSIGRIRKINFVFDSRHISSFRIGASIYVGSFILGYNFEYRLIFLIFSLPQILEWIKFKGSSRYLSLISLISLILICWIDFWHSNLNLSFFIKDSLTWLLFVYLFFMLLNTLPDWAKIKRENSLERALK